VHLHDDPDDGPDELGQDGHGGQGRVGTDSQPEEGSDNEDWIGGSPGVGAGLLAVSALILALAVGHDSHSGGNEEEGSSEETHSSDSAVELDSTVVVVDGVPIFNMFLVHHESSAVKVLVNWCLIDINHVIKLFVKVVLLPLHSLSPFIGGDHVVWSVVFFGQFILLVAVNSFFDKFVIEIEIPVVDQSIIAPVVDVWVGPVVFFVFKWVNFLCIFIIPFYFFVFRNFWYFKFRNFCIRVSVILSINCLNIEFFIICASYDIWEVS